MENSNAIIDKNTMTIENTKFWSAKIPSDAVICASCGRQVEAFNGTIQQSAAMPNIVINNANIYSNVNTSGYDWARQVGWGTNGSFLFCVYYWVILSVINFTKGKPAWEFFIFLPSVYLVLGYCWFYYHPFETQSILCLSLDFWQRRLWNRGRLYF